MASAPPADPGQYYSGYPQPPSYEQTLNAPQVPYGFAPPPPGYSPAPPGYDKTPQQAYSPQQAYPPQQGYPPQTFNQPYPQQPVTTVPAANVTVQTLYVQPAAVFGDFPVVVNCPVCAQMVTTQVVRKDGVLTWLACVALAFVGCIYGCCLIPFCVDGAKDAEHHCPTCKSVLGVYKRL
ncbi:lipopolysaccharide-induced tumor necrosis factor-alpha factor homolog [Engraulis encrasicolus]|uniref:lipopolysaccharide-induced tumor necrosis factor-alpha factor homolog n=1 Tax=Engraulis encrasicolus TaxID=184585 RepID=UPI002FCF7358